MKEIKIDGIDFELRETDIVEEGHVYCRKCGKRVDGDKLELRNFKLIPRIWCDCDKKREEQQKIREKELEISRLKQISFNSNAQYKYRFENTQDKNSKSYTISKNYVDNFEKMKKDNVGLLFYGNVGSGKTYLACAIANELIERNLISVRVRNLSQIINELQKAEFYEDKNQIISNLVNTTLLVLDDFGIERDTSYAKEQVYNIINERYLKGKPTIFTTNLSLSKIQNENESIENQRIYSRILEMTIPIKVLGNDRRLQIHKDKLEKYKDMLLSGCIL